MNIMLLYGVPPPALRGGGIPRMGQSYPRARSMARKKRFEG